MQHVCLETHRSLLGWMNPVFQPLDGALYMLMSSKLFQSVSVARRLTWVDLSKSVSWGKKLKLQRKKDGRRKWWQSVSEGSGDAEQESHSFRLCSWKFVLDVRGQTGLDVGFLWFPTLLSSALLLWALCLLSLCVYICRLCTRPEWKKKQNTVAPKDMHHFKSIQHYVWVPTCQFKTLW